MASERTPKASIGPAIAELERCYGKLLPIFSLPKDIPPPVIIIASHGRRKNTLGWCGPLRWKQQDAVLNEINLCAEFLGRSVLAIAETLVHEMVHHVNTCLEVDDCKSGYHNKHFRSLAESVGLNVEKQGSHGWAQTSLTDSLRSRVEKLKIDPAAFEIYRNTDIAAQTAATRMKKWKCGCTIVRCATELNAECGECGELFGQEE